MIVRYWPKHKPIPEGWVLKNDLLNCHHGEWSVLIEKTDKEPEGEVESNK